MRRCRLLMIVAVACVLSVAAGAGCKKGTPTTCKGWAKYLKSPVRARDAIKNLGDLRCKESLADLEAIFPTSQYKDDILTTVKAINDPKGSISLLKKALADPSAAILAAAVAEDFAAPELRPALLEILSTDKAMKARLNALKALAKLDQASLKADEDLLIQLLRNDPNLQGFEVNALAAELLGHLASEKAVPDLVVGLFVRAQHGGALYSSCRKALVRIGKPAVDAIVGVMTNDPKAADLIKALDDSAKRMGIASWQWRDGPEFIQVLGDLRDPVAAKVIAASLAKPLVPPVGVDQRVMQTWQMAQQNRIAMAMIGLWNTGDASVATLLEEVVLTVDNDAKQRLDTATTISLLPNFAGIGPLLDIYRKSSEEGFRAPLLKPIALGLDWAHQDAFMRLIAADRSDFVKERATGKDADAVEFKAIVNVLRDCKEGDTDCLIAKLKGDDPVISGKAAVLLAGMKGVDSKKALAALFEKYPATDPISMVDLRRFMLLAIWRLGDATNVPDVERLLRSDRDRKGAGYWIDELETFIPPLSRKAAR